MYKTKAAHANLMSCLSSQADAAQKMPLPFNTQNTQDLWWADQKKNFLKFVEKHRHGARQKLQAVKAGKHESNSFGSTLQHKNPEVITRIRRAHLYSLLSRQIVTLCHLPLDFWIISISSISLTVTVQTKIFTEHILRRKDLPTSKSTFI